MKKYIIEGIGTFFLVLVVGLSGNPIAIGVVLTSLVYMGGYISGANYNPAVTLALWVSKKTTSAIAIRYMLAQLLGALAASLAYFIIRSSYFIPAIGHGVNFMQALLVEILFTFLLASVVLHVAATDKTKGNNYFGIAIGFALLAGAMAGGPISGGAYNPAVGVGPLLFDIAQLPHHFSGMLLYLLGPLIGGALAGLVYKTK